MQITRMNNQPNFKAKVDTKKEAKTIARYLSSPDVKAFATQRKELRQLGEDNTSFAIGFTPKNLGPFRILAEHKHPTTGETSVKFKEGIHLSELAKKGRELYLEMKREIKAAPVYKPVGKSYHDFVADTFSIMR